MGRPFKQLERHWARNVTSEKEPDRWNKLQERSEYGTMAKIRLEYGNSHMLEPNPLWTNGKHVPARLQDTDFGGPHHQGGTTSVFSVLESVHELRADGKHLPTRLQEAGDHVARFK